MARTWALFSVGSGCICGVFLTTLTFVTLVCDLVPGAEGHGRLMDPPSRSSMWRVGFSNPHNYDDNQLFCGGVNLQWQTFGGRCGLCGDPWSGPRDNEPGGKYANGIVTRRYEVGQVIEVHVQLTANHKGWFEFHLCQHDNPFTNITMACLDKHLLVLDDTGQTRYPVAWPASAVSNGSDAGVYTAYSSEIRLKLRLPPGLACSACVLQWKYNSGNSWGTDAETGQSCIGCGPQEQFYGCADIAIGDVENSVTGIPSPKFPWYFQDPGAEWHYGIAYVFGTRGGDRASISAAARSTPVESSTLIVIAVLTMFPVIR